jgi:hypothetical protein
MNNKKTAKKIMKKPSTRTTIASATIIAIVAAYAMILGMRSEISPSALAQSYGSNGTTAATTANSIVSVNPNQSTNKEFWISTVHLDGMTNLKAPNFVIPAARIHHYIQQRSLL